MKAIDLICPTRGRPKKLLKMVQSVPAAAEGVEVRIVLGFDGDPVTAGRFRDLSTISRVEDMPRMGSIALRNSMLQRCDDAVLYAVDDIIFRPGAIEAAVRTMKARFPDEDGLVGFRVEGDRGQCPAGVGLAGRRFVERYPGKKLFFPGYYHFGAQEVHRAAVIWGKFIFESEAVIFHSHPAFYPKEMDRTHEEARAWRKKDLDLSRARERAGLTWGVKG
jgi:hypothetical protein